MKKLEYRTAAGAVEAIYTGLPRCFSCSWVATTAGGRPVTDLDAGRAKWFSDLRAGKSRKEEILYGGSAVACGVDDYEYILSFAVLSGFKIRPAALEAIRTAVGDHDKVYAIMAALG